MNYVFRLTLIYILFFPVLSYGNDDYTIDEIGKTKEWSVHTVRQAGELRGCLIASRSDYNLNRGQISIYYIYETNNLHFAITPIKSLDMHSVEDFVFIIDGQIFNGVPLYPRNQERNGFGNTVAKNLYVDSELTDPFQLISIFRSMKDSKLFLSVLSRSRGIILQIEMKEYFPAFFIFEGCTQIIFNN